MLLRLPTNPSRRQHADPGGMRTRARGAEGAAFFSNRGSCGREAKVPQVVTVAANISHTHQISSWLQVCVWSPCQVHCYGSRPETTADTTQYSPSMPKRAVPILPGRAKAPVSLSLLQRASQRPIDSSHEHFGAISPRVVPGFGYGSTYIHRIYRVSKSKEHGLTGLSVSAAVSGSPARPASSRSPSSMQTPRQGGDAGT